MKFSQAFCPTLKEVPKEAEVVSHQLMLRAGLIRRVASGIYTYLPMGYRALRKFEQIVREEMDRVGGQEILMPFVIPAELWQESGRWEKYGPELLRIQDRHKNEFCLGPTHEEVVTDVARLGIKSYRQLPVTLYQIQTKFRDEIRPRFGLMRGREFGMKDAYSFHINQESLQETYDKMAVAYKRIFQRAGLETLQVEADSGAIGGSKSAEFMVTAQTGEDRVMVCESCGHGANVEVFGEGVELTCPSCKSANLKEVRGIEVGHIFQLGSIYSDKMAARFLDDTGKEKPFEMGCYGIGIGRTVAAAIEQHHDADGIIWPIGLAPYLIDIIAIQSKDSEALRRCDQIYTDLSAHGFEVILDDRPISPGIKFKDAALIGFPFTIVAGQKFMDSGIVEVKNRRTGEMIEMSIDQLRGFFDVQK